MDEGPRSPGRTQQHIVRDRKTARKSTGGGSGSGAPVVSVAAPAAAVPIKRDKKTARKSSGGGSEGPVVSVAAPAAPVPIKRDKKTSRKSSGGGSGAPVAAPTNPAAAPAAPAALAPPSAAPAAPAVDAAQGVEAMHWADGASFGPEAEERGRRELEERLKTYNRLKVEHKDSAKPDMSACREMRERGLLPPMTYGLLPGVDAGRIFKEKGELEAGRLHSGIMRGIGWPSGRIGPAYSICLSGAYHDDDDKGEAFDYTGMGTKGDQSYINGNEALRQNVETKTPVRVMRRLEKPKNSSGEAAEGSGASSSSAGGSGSSSASFCYIYEGLYDVTRTWVQTSSESGNPRKVVQFRIERHRDNSKAAATSVQFRKQAYNALTGGVKEGRYVRHVLAGGSRARGGVKRGAGSSKQQQMGLEAREEARLLRLRDAPGLLALDISGGTEPVRIPVFNTEDDDPAPQIEYLQSTQVLQCLQSNPPPLPVSSISTLYPPLICSPVPPSLLLLLCLPLLFLLLLLPLLCQLQHLQSTPPTPPSPRLPTNPLLLPEINSKHPFLVPKAGRGQKA